MIFAHLKIHVEQIKEIVILMMNARMAFSVDLIIAQITLTFILNLIAVMPQLLDMNIFVHLEYLVEKMREIVIPKMNVKLVLDVQAVLPILDSVQIYIVARKEVLIMENGVFVQVVTHVALMKVIVTVIVNVKMV